MTAPSHGHAPMTIFVTEKPEYVVDASLSAAPVSCSILETKVDDDGRLDFEWGSSETWHEDEDNCTGYDPVANINIPEFVAKRPWRIDEMTNPNDSPLTLIVRSIDCSIVLDDGTAASLLYTEAKGLHIGTHPMTGQNEYKIPASTLSPTDVRIEALNRSLTNQSPNPLQIERIEALRCLAKTFGEGILRNTPYSREQSTAITNLEQCLMWAVKSIILEKP